MKKLILTAGFIVALSGGLFAQTRPGNGNGNGNGNGTPGTNKDCPAFVDKNNNKICDNYENGTCPNVRNGQGQCQYSRGQGNGVRARDGSGPRCRRAPLVKV